MNEEECGFERELPDVVVKEEVVETLVCLFLIPPCSSVALIVSSMVAN